jgi:hypothetical protein
VALHGISDRAAETWYRNGPGVGADPAVEICCYDSRARSGLSIEILRTF